MSEDIFDTFQTEDLDEETKSQIHKKPRAFTELTNKKVLELFSLKDNLSVDEVIVALARKFSIKAQRNKVMGKIYALRNKGLILSNGTDRFYLVKKD